MRARWRHLVVLTACLSAGVVVGAASPAGAPAAIPPSAVTFALDVQAIGIFEFGRCVGIGSETSVIVVQDPDTSILPDDTLPLRLTCQRGYVADPTLADWRQSIVEGPFETRPARLVMYDATLEEIGSWVYIDIWPTSLIVQPDSSGLPFEVVTFSADNVFPS